MKFLLDECMPHVFVGRLAGRGYPDAIHPIHVGLLMAADHTIVSRALADDRIIITTNGVDYRDLLSKQTLHPGLILLPNSPRDLNWRLLLVALDFIELQTRPVDFMVNRVVEVSANEGIRPYELPPSGP